MEFSKLRFGGLKKCHSYPLPTLITEPSEKDMALVSSRIRPSEICREAAQTDDVPSFIQKHARSPSEGERHLLSVIKAQLSPRNEKVTKESQSVPSGILNKLFSPRKLSIKDKLWAKKSTEEGKVEHARRPRWREKVIKSDHEMDIQVIRYRSLSPHERITIRDLGCPTPPLAVFSSDEDISSTPATPKRNIRTTVSTNKVTSTSFTGETRSNIILPQLEEPIDQLILHAQKNEPCSKIDGNASVSHRTEVLLNSDDLDTVKVANLSSRPINPIGQDVLLGNVHTCPGMHTKKPLREYGGGRRHISTNIPVLKDPPVRPQIKRSVASCPENFSLKIYTTRRHHTTDFSEMKSLASPQGTSRSADSHSSITESEETPFCAPNGCSQVNVGVPVKSTSPLSSISRNTHDQIVDYSDIKKPITQSKSGSCLNDTNSFNNVTMDYNRTPAQVCVQDQTDQVVSHGRLSPLKPCVYQPVEDKTDTPTRPRSESLNVRWADEDDNGCMSVRPSVSFCWSAVRAKESLSDPGDRTLSEVLGKCVLRDKFDSLSTLPQLDETEEYMVRSLSKRRMSTPHPIKMRSSRSPPLKRHSKKIKLKKASSAPDILDMLDTSACSRKRRKHSIFQASSLEAGDLAIAPAQLSSDEEEDEEECISDDSASLGAASETASLMSGKQSILEEIFEEESSTYAEALWDHVTLDREELAFQAGDVIEVLDKTDKDWWWGRIVSNEGWLPAAFVRLRANQLDTADDLAQKVKDGTMDSDTAFHKYSVSQLSKDQARTNVLKEIITAENEYVGHLKDVVEGYLDKARKRPEMFSNETLETIFGNIEEIFTFSKTFLEDLEKHISQHSWPDSEIGQCFLKHRKGFEIYSTYCNNHPSACDELPHLQQNKKYIHFFEACRLLQSMIEIPLEGFLLTPVQKICKYPLQLRELLRHTRPEHPDYETLEEALNAMKGIAMLINERKRKMEGLEKLAQWQRTVQDWEGPNVFEESSELVHSGEMTKVNPSGWHQDRVFFLFDHQMVYCKKDLLWRDVMIYRGRINMDKCEIYSVTDGKDTMFNVNVKNAIKIFDRTKDKWYMLYCRTPEEKECWCKAFKDERSRVQLDQQSGFDLSQFRRHVTLSSRRHKYRSDRYRDKFLKNKKRGTVNQPDLLRNLPPHTSIPRTINGRAHAHTLDKKKRVWFPFKSKR